jgi:hypothetical protein
MPGSDAVAQALVEYDAQLAEHVLRLVAKELGIDVAGDAGRLAAAIAQFSADTGSAKTTIEWKAGFAHIERLRSLGLSLARLLGARAEEG